MKRPRFRMLVGLAAGALLLVTGACAGNQPQQQAATIDENAPVTITVGDRPTPDKPADLASFERKVKEFTDLHPNIKVETTETKWEAKTFQAKLAGGSLPTVMNVSFTEPQNMIRNKQLPDITDALKQVDLLDKLNPATLKIVQDAEGRVYGVPIDVFSVGLAYNRDLFTKAGLDPDKPPTSWDEVRSYAKQIAEKTGKAGYAQLTTNNTGGWMLSTMTYSLGGSVQSPDGKASTFNDAPMKQALQLLKDMRWTDKAMGSQFLYNQEDVRQDFAAGKIGMVMQAPDAYDMSVKNFGMDPADFGMAGLPQAGGVHGTLTGGSIKMISVKSTPEQVLAGLKWIEYDQFRKYTDEKIAVDDAKNVISDKGFVGRPALSPLSQQVWDQYLAWIKPQTNVPVEQFNGYVETAKTYPLIPEPANRAQEVYAALDPVVQEVLTKEDADIDDLLAKASTAIDAKLRR